MKYLTILSCFLQARRKHHVLYLDGEEEWLDLSRENLVWVKATRHGAISAGVVTGGNIRQLLCVCAPDCWICPCLQLCACRVAVDCMSDVTMSCSMCSRCCSTSCHGHAACVHSGYDKLVFAGVPMTGDDVPKGRDALGWRIAVYWKDDRMFYEGEIIDFENSTGRHKVGPMLGFW